MRVRVRGGIREGDSGEKVGVCGVASRLKVRVRGGVSGGEGTVGSWGGWPGLDDLTVHWGWAYAAGGWG